MLLGADYDRVLIPHPGFRHLEFRFGPEPDITAPYGTLRNQKKVRLLALD